MVKSHWNLLEIFIKKIILVRHSLVDEKYINRYNGHIDISLSQNGIKEAKKLALKLNTFKFDKIYCSDLKRAKQTLNEFDLDIDVIYSKQLREKSWGVDEGKSFNELTKEGKKYIDFIQWIDSLDGEHVDEFIFRVKEYFFNTILKDSANTILVVTHSGVIKVLIHILKNISLEDAFSQSLPYSSYIEIDY
jgi:broad specificity phosphatase PhoE